MHQQACTQTDTSLAPDLSYINAVLLTCKHRVRACAFRWAHFSKAARSLRYLTDIYKKKQNEIISEVPQQQLPFTTSRSICPEYRVSIHLPLPWPPQDEANKNPMLSYMNTKITRQNRAVENKVCVFTLGAPDFLIITGKLAIQISPLRIVTLASSLFCESPKEGNLLLCDPSTCVPQQQLAIEIVIPKFFLFSYMNQLHNCISRDFNIKKQHTISEGQFLNATPHLL